MKTRASQNFSSLLSKLAVLFFLLVALSGGARTVQAQDDTPKRGFQPANSFALSDVETVNTTNGNLILNLPKGEGYFEIRPDGFLETCSGGQWTSNDLTYYSVDGTFLKLVIKHNSAHNGLWNNEWTLYFPDGGRVTFNEPGAGGQRIYDRNNNYIELQNTTHNGHPATKLVDQVGRWVILEYNSGLTVGENSA